MLFGGTFKITIRSQNSITKPHVFISQEKMGLLNVLYLKEVPSFRLVALICYNEIVSCHYSLIIRVKRLGFFDHTQRQLGERALYVFPTKSETTRITCEGPEGTPAHPEDPVVRKVWLISLLLVLQSVVR